MSAENDKKITRRGFFKRLFTWGVLAAIGSLPAKRIEASPGPAPIEQKGLVIQMSKTIKAGDGTVYGWKTQDEERAGMFGGNKIWYSIDGGATWLDTNFNNMSPDFLGGRPSVFVTDAVIGKSGVAYFLVVPAVQAGSNDFTPASPFARVGPPYKDTVNGFIRNPGQLEVERADSKGKLVPVKNFGGVDPVANRLQFLEVAK